MNKALFLDRDGVLIKERGDYNFLDEHFILNENIIPLLQLAQKKNYLLIVITNQGGIAKGLYDHKHVKKMHGHISEALKKHKIEILDYFYCPHHSTIEKCLCRKPNSLMLEKATAIHNIDRSKSIMIGDRITDKQAAEKIGIRGVEFKANTCPEISIL